MEMFVHIMQTINQIELEKCTFIVKNSPELGISIFSSDDIAAGWKED
jgi:hypothetical protein